MARERRACEPPAAPIRCALTRGDRARPRIDEWAASADGAADVRIGPPPIERCRLRVGDLDFERCQIVVRGGTSNKNRATFQHGPAGAQADLAMGIPGSQHARSCAIQSGVAE